MGSVMRIGELYRDGQLGISFEIYPPKTEKGAQTLLQRCEELASYNPVFISGTYGAGGSEPRQNLQLLEEVRKRCAVSTTAHLTCVGSTSAFLKEWLTDARARGVENIMALRGDLPAGVTSLPATDEFRYANELVRFIKENFPEFGIGVAGYPETHREAANPQADLDNLKRKVDAGADAIFTQLFFDNEDFFRFRDRCAAAGIAVPIIPGIMPVLSLQQVERITVLCGASLPASLVGALKKSDEVEAQIEVGTEHAIRQSESLVRNGAPGIHYYVLNRCDVIGSVLSALTAAEVVSIGKRAKSRSASEGVSP